MKKIIILFLIFSLVLSSCSKNDDEIANKNKTSDEMEHIFSKEWSYNDEKHFHYCIDKGYETLKSDEEKHIFNGWIVIVEPTAYNIGYKKQECNVCGYEKYESIPKIAMYSVKLDLNGGTSESIKDNNLTIPSIDKAYFSFDLKKENNEFVGWAVDGNLVFDKDGNIINKIELKSGMIFKAIFDNQAEINYIFTLYNPETGELIEKYDKVPNDICNFQSATHCHIGQIIALYAIAEQGYIFEGWYLDEFLLSNQNIYNLLAWGNATLELRFTYDKYDLTVSSNSKNAGKVLIKNGPIDVYSDNITEKRYYKQDVTIAALTNSSEVFIGWFDESGLLVSRNPVYSFEMPCNNYKLEARWGISV